MSFHKKVLAAVLRAVEDPSQSDHPAIPDNTWNEHVLRAIKRGRIEVIGTPAYSVHTYQNIDLSKYRLTDEGRKILDRYNETVE